MQTYKVNLPQDVINEIEQYVEYIALDNIDAALKWYQEVRNKIISLETDPQRCPLAYEDIYHKYEIRNLVIGNYRVLFRIVEDIVQILHIKHSKMKPRKVE